MALHLPKIRGLNVIIKTTCTQVADLGGSTDPRIQKSFILQSALKPLNIAP